MSPRAYPAYKQQNISVIVMLADDDECLQKAKCNLLGLYAADGFHVIHLPISDFSVPTSKDLRVALDQTIDQARKGKHVVIHCSAGIGRTGLFAACLARAILGLPAEKAIEWVRRYIPGAVETPSQRLFVAAQQF